MEKRVTSPPQRPEDPALPALTMDILSHVLSRADNPGGVGDYVAEEIRELTGARCLLLIQCTGTAGTAHRIISVNPVRRREWAAHPATQHLYEIAHSLPAAQLVSAEEPSEIAGYLKEQNFDLSMIVPLHLGDLRIGAMLILGLPDEQHISSMLDLLENLSTIIALVLRNSFLFEQQERIIAVRTEELQNSNNQLHIELAERKRAQQALGESEAKYRRIVDTAAEGIWMLGPDAITTSVNGTMAAMLGYDAEEMTGLPLTDFMFEEDVPDHRGKMENRRQGLSEHYERRFRHKDGQTVWTYASATPVFDGGHRFNGSFAMFTGITQRKQAEQDLHRLNAELEQRVAERTAALEAANGELELFS